MKKNGIYMLWLLSMVFFLSITISVVNAAPTNDINKTTVKGKFKDNGHSLRNALVIIREKGKLDWIHTMTDANGTFNTPFSDGTYAVLGVKDENGNWYSTNETFVVNEGKIDGFKNEEIDLSQKKKEKKPDSDTSNFKGKLKEGNKGLAADLIISKYNENEEEIIRVSSKANGNFTATLEGGNYFLFGIEDVNGGFYKYELEFEVKKGTMIFDDKSQKKLTITLPIDTFSGKVEDSTTSITGANIVLEKRLSEDEYDTEFIQSVITDTTGSFSLRALADGMYSLSVYHDTYYSWKHVLVEVTNGAIFINGTETPFLQVKIPDINLIGKVLEGDQPISNATVIFESQKNGEYFWYNTRTDVDGEFQYRLGDGTYTIRYIDEQNRFTELSVPFEIREGKIFQNEYETSLINIDLPPVFYGKLVESGKPIQGSVSLYKIDGSQDWSINAQADEMGVFSFRLTDGSYRVSNGFLNSDGEQITFNTIFDIKNGQLFINSQEKPLIELQVPAISLHGLVKDGDSIVDSGMVSVTSNQHGAADIWKNIDSDGSFTMRLTDGKYYIRSIQIEDGTSVEIFQSFSIVDGKTYENGELKEVLEIAVPPNTLTGILTEDSAPIIGDLYIIEINEPDNPLQFWGTTTEDGKFQFRMQDGDYRVSNVSLSDGLNYSPGTEFSIRSGKLYINGELTDMLSINVPPINLSGTVTNGEVPVNQGYVSITLLSGRYFPGSTGEIQNGYYQARLHDGEYEISYVYDYLNGYYETKIRFVISNGKLYVNGQEATTLDINLHDFSQ